MQRLQQPSKGEACAHKSHKMRVAACNPMHRLWAERGCWNACGTLLNVHATKGQVQHLLMDGWTCLWYLNV